MKKFDLKAALNGEPVMLRNGQKAYIKYNLLDEIKSLNVKVGMYPLVGYRLEYNYINNTSWDVLGIAKYHATREYDIIGMYEEPKISIEDLPKPFKPKEGEVYYSIGGYHNGTIVKMQANCMTDISILSGNCFRAESDAKAWLDAMKNALDD